MNEHSLKKEHRPYNSTIVDNYLSFVSEKYPEINMYDIFSEANIMPWEVSDPGHWFTQKQINDFYDALANKIEYDGEVSLARSVGKFTASDRSNKFIRLAAAHLLNMNNMFPVVDKIVAKFITAVSVDWKKIHDSKYELTFTFKEHIRPRKFQCENTIGHMEAFVYSFTNKWPKIEHPECHFRSQGHCRYIISWERAAYLSVNKIRFLFIIISAITTVSLFAFSFHLTAALALVIAVVVDRYLDNYSELLEKRESIETFKRNQFKILDLYDVLSDFHDYTKVFGEAAKSISSHATVEEVLKKFGDTLQGLGYEKGLICLLNDKLNELQLSHVFGYGDKKNGVKEQLADIPFGNPLNMDAKSIKMQDNMNALRHRLPDAIITEFVDITMPLYIPMIYERSLIGFIVAHNTRGHENLTGSDISLVQAVASQTALVITNISAFETVTANEKLKNQFLTMASHELRTPIQAIFLAYDDIVDKLSNEKRGVLKHSLVAIEKGVLRLQNITDNLLKLSKIEARDSLDEKPVRVEELLDQVQYETEHLIRHNKHKLNIKNMLVGNDRLLCDSGLLVQVLTNLVNNSAKFTFEGGSIEIRINKNTAELNIDVIDNGRGIPHHAHEKVFMKFYQVDDMAPTIENDGCGLGLSFCQEAVRKHGGYITVKSPLLKTLQPGSKLDEQRKGTLFRIHLPLERLKFRNRKKGLYRAENKNRIGSR